MASLEARMRESVGGYPAHILKAPKVTPVMGRAELARIQSLWSKPGEFYAGCAALFGAGGGSGACGSANGSNGKLGMEEIKRAMSLWPTPTTSVASIVEENRVLKGLNEHHENEIAVLTRALQMAKSKIERVERDLFVARNVIAATTLKLLEARGEPDAAGPTDACANAFKADRLLDAYGR